MARRTIYTCDMCKEEVDSFDFRLVHISYTTPYQRNPEVTDEKPFEVCKICLSRLVTSVKEFIKYG